MAYTAPGAKALRLRKGTINDKVAAELALVDAELAVVQAGERTLAENKIFVGDGDGLAAAVTMSGDATIAATGAITIAAEAVTLAKMADLARGSLISGQTAGNRPTALDAKGAGKILVGDGTDLASVSVSGDATLAATGAVTIANNAITSAKTALANGKHAIVALTPGNADAIAASWQNPEAVPIIARTALYVGTGGGTALAVMNVGSGDEAGSAPSTALHNGADITAKAVFLSTGMVILDANGGTTDFINAQIKTANAAALAGALHIWYTAATAV